MRGRPRGPRHAPARQRGTCREETTAASATSRTLAVVVCRIQRSERRMSLSDRLKSPSDMAKAHVTGGRTGHGGLPRHHHPGVPQEYCGRWVRFPLPVTEGPCQNVFSDLGLDFFSFISIFRARYVPRHEPAPWGRRPAQPTGCAVPRGPVGYRVWVILRGSVTSSVRILPKESGVSSIIMWPVSGISV